jgi:hypothetical protein
VIGKSAVARQIGMAMILCTASSKRRRQWRSTPFAALF